MTCLLLFSIFFQAEDAYVQADARRIEKYRKILEKTPDDPEANFQVGRHLCLVRVDWDQGLPLLSKGKDKALAEMAQYELGSLELPSGKDSPLTGATVDFGDAVAVDLIRGDMLWAMAKKFKDPELRNLMNRTLWRYRAALSKVEDKSKPKLLDRISKVLDRYKLSYTHPGRVVDGPPKNWGVVVSKGEKIEGVAVDESRSHSGKCSLKVTPAKAGLLVTQEIPIHPGEHVLSFWYLSEGTVAPDLLRLLVYNVDGSQSQIPAPMPPDKGDIPIWVKVEMKVKIDEKVLKFRIYIDNVGMRDGALWVDDLSLKSPKGEELIPNGGFEDGK